MGILMLGAVMMALLLALGFGLRVIDEAEMENRLIEAELQSSRMYGAALDARAQEVRRYRHDANGLLWAIEFALAEGRAADGADPGAAPVDEGADAGEVADAARNVAAQADLGRTSGAGSLGGFRSIEGVPTTLLQAIIALKERQCSEAGITFSCDVGHASVRGAIDRGVEEGDLCALLQNLLDNAYEASLAIDDPDDRFMSLEVSSTLAATDDASNATRTGAKLRIVVTNRVKAGERPTFSTRKANPELHGIGLRIVDDIVKRYGGAKTVDFDQSQRLLTMTVEA